MQLIGRNDELEADGGVGPHGPGVHQAGGLVVEQGEPFGLVAPFLRAEGVGKLFAGGRSAQEPRSHEARRWEQRRELS